MVQRKMSSIDLLDYIEDRSFLPAPILASLSLAKLNQLLAEPIATTSNLNPAEVSGKTDLLTLGIVFSNSGTKIASSGNAYCSISLGTLGSGPCLSLLLFGSAYSKHCQACPAGTVLLLRYPRLLPMKPDGPTKYCCSFSVSDDEQCINVGKSRDFGFCKAKVRGKDETGRWVDNARPCKNFVDTRIGDYCAEHKAKMNEKSGPKMQMVRSDMNAVAPLPFAVRAQKIMTGPSTDLQGRGGLAGGPVSTSIRQTILSALGERTPDRRLATKTSNTVSNKANSILNPRNRVTSQSSQILSAQPSPHLLNEIQSKEKITGNLQNGTRQAGRGFAARATIQASTNDTVRFKVPKKRSHSQIQPYRGSNDLLGKALQKSVRSYNSERLRIEGSDRLAKENMPRRKLNTDVSGFDGTVPVPSRGALAKNLMPGTAWDLKRGSVSHRMSLDQKKHERVLEQQKKVAALVQGTPKVGTKPKVSKPTHNDFFASVSLEAYDPETVRNKESRFSNIAQAENLAASKRKLEKLGEIESKSQPKEQKTIEKYWHCRTCSRDYNFDPRKCYRQDHDVSMRRRLKQPVLDTRQKSSRDDDNLKLGSGLEWSFNHRSS